jgi:KDO2-lipid IV(A) lauroyltransferase
VKTVRYRLEALAAATLFRLFAALPRRVASTLGGAAGRSIGWILPPVSKIADRNLRRVWPDMDRSARRRIIVGVWDNIGRNAAEMPHIHHCRIGPDGDIVVTGETILRDVATASKPAIFVSAHLANWEIFAHTAAHYGLLVARVYRAANNPLVEAQIQKIRAHVPGGCIPKGAKGAREILRALSGGRSIGMLIDQRMSDGEIVPFFGLPARTATAHVDLALRFGCPIIPVQGIRLPDSRFEIVMHPPITVTRDTRDAVLLQLNQLLETWIRARPEHWLWVHNRWKDARSAQG